MKRRNFLSAVGAVLVAPIAAVEEIATGADNTVLRRNPITCASCGDDDITATAWNYEWGMGQENEGPFKMLHICLCDPCAENLGYLCENRLKAVGRNQWVASYQCDCGLRGCPGERQVSDEVHE